jgi:transglutaminase-like putative cysteine protease
VDPERETHDHGDGQPLMRTTVRESRSTAELAPRTFRGARFAIVSVALDWPSPAASSARPAPLTASFTLTVRSSILACPPDTVSFSATSATLPPECKLASVNELPVWRSYRWELNVRQQLPDAGSQLALSADTYVEHPGQRLSRLSGTPVEDPGKRA